MSIEILKGFVPVCVHAQSLRLVQHLEKVIMLLDDALQEARLAREAMLLYIQVNEFYIDQNLIFS